MSQQERFDDMTDRAFDVISVGGGPAGAALVIALSRRGMRAALVESKADDAWQVGETLPGRARLALEQLGLAESFALEGHALAHARQSIWGSPRVSEMSSLFDPYGPGFHVDRARMNIWLWSEAERAGVRVLRATRVREVSWSGAARRWTLRCDGEECGDLRSSLLADATGHSAWLSRHLGASRVATHPMVGVARWFSSRAESPMLVEAAAEGVWYSAPLPSERRVAVWLTHPENHTARAGTTRALWEECLACAPETAARLAGATEIGPAKTRLTGPAFTDFRDPRPWLPVGDARFSLDPLSGDGLRAAFDSALAASDALSATATDASALERYRRQGETEFLLHLKQRRVIYAAESRFRGSSFWSQSV